MSYEHFVNNYQRYLKSPRTLSESFKTAEYCSAITLPKKREYDSFGAFLGGLAFVAIFAYCFWRTLGN